MAHRDPTPGQKAQVAAALRATREKRGLSQKELNAIVGSHVVNQIESRRSGMSMSTLFAVVEALGCTWGEVLGPEPNSDGGRSADWEAGYRAGIGEAHAALSRLMRNGE